MAAPMFDFLKVRDSLTNYLKEDTANLVVVQLKQRIGRLEHGSAVEKKNALDQSFRDILKQNLIAQEDADKWKHLVNFAIQAAKEDLCSLMTPFQMMSDIFDALTLEKCDDIFTFVEERVFVWKSDIFYNSGKNFLLRMCNDLLRRMSRSQNTIFCGRIQLFLAVLFPLTEKSGLNLTSEFNLENITTFNKNAEDVKAGLIKSRDDSTSMEIEDGEEIDDNTLMSNYNMYRKFWSLQDYFRKPIQCYDKVAWRQFYSYADEVLKAFASSKLDDMKSSRRKLERPKTADSHTYFAKYLTSEKLLDLQMNDSNFRRHILVQFLILFKYLKSTVKQKQPHMTLTDDQSKWVKDTTDLVYRLLTETPPDGQQFAATIQHTLNREDNWNNWKNDNCPSYIREPEEKEEKPKAIRSRKRSIGEDIKASGGKIIKMGNSELTRLWNIDPDNMEVCTGDKRVFLPTLETFFEDAILEADPQQQVDEQDKQVNQGNFSWRALRLLARRSSYFFSQNNTPFKKTSEYLETTILKIAKDSKPDQPNVSISEEPKLDNGQEMEEGELKDDDPADLTNAEDEEKKDKMQNITKEQLHMLTDKLGSDWKKLATELNFSQDEIFSWENDYSNVNDQAMTMIKLWMDGEPEKGAQNAMKSALKELGLLSVANEVFGH